MFTRTGVFKEASPGSCSPFDAWRRLKAKKNRLVSRDVGWICSMWFMYIHTLFFAYTYIYIYIYIYMYMYMHYIHFTYIYTYIYIIWTCFLIILPKNFTNPARFFLEYGGPETSQLASTTWLMNLQDESGHGHKPCYSNPCKPLS